MQKLIDIITLAIATIFGYKATIAAQAKQIEDLTTANARLASDDSADKAAVKAAQDKQAELEAQALEVDAKATELAAALEDHPNTPTVDPETFAVTETGDPVKA